MLAMGDITCLVLHNMHQHVIYNIADIGTLNDIFLKIDMGVS